MRKALSFAAIVLGAAVSAAARADTLVLVDNMSSSPISVQVGAAAAQGIPSGRTFFNLKTGQMLTVLYARPFPPSLKKLCDYTSQPGSGRDNRFTLLVTQGAPGIACRPS